MNIIKSSNKIVSFVKNIAYYLISSRCSYAQEGEDLVLASFYEGRDIYKGGFFVDVGAYHPTRFSNTYFFYKRGWRGINIDANPNAIKYFKWLRKRDINLNVGISKNGGGGR